ncbi:MAG: hypothetical protein R3355_11975 [Pseudomonas sp.]|uniref:hypothetical protein n=1 Tax=Pseudomonas sp. TaxID=306 RepID=UPI00299E70A8|nr:hypothetical protein [Pseudomonas sp.]MDX1723804.1 hypothetical protein [Pseudomonas sp.]
MPGDCDHLQTPCRERLEAASRRRAIFSPPLSAEALPLLTSRLVRRCLSTLPLRSVRWRVYVLMGLAGASLNWGSLPGLLAARPA